MSVEGSLHVTGDISGGAMATFDQRVTSLEQQHVWLRREVCLFAVRRPGPAAIAVEFNLGRRRPGVVQLRGGPHASRRPVLRHGQVQHQVALVLRSGRGAAPTARSGSARLPRRDSAEHCEL